MRKMRYVVTRSFVLILACVSMCGCDEHNEAPKDKVEYVECGIDEYCEVVIVDGVRCYKKPCGEINTCLVCDKHEANLKVSSTSINVHEAGGAVPIAFMMTEPPVSDVTITATISDETEVKLDTESIVFTAEDWKTPHMFYARGINDGIRDGDTVSVLTFVVTTEDENYAKFGPYKVSVKCVDDGEEIASHIILKRSPVLETSEDGVLEVSLAFKLDTKPDSDVVIKANVSDSSEGHIEPTELVFTAENYSVEQIMTVSGVDDDETDGAQRYIVSFDVESADSRFSNEGMPVLTFVNRDDESNDEPGEYDIRVMASNTTAGSGQSYDSGEGIRFFQAMKPDIALIQEFNYGKNTMEDLRSFTTIAFGPEYYYSRGEGKIPNGIVSRYPIVEWGAWTSNVTTDRRWDWAVIDVPGPIDVLAVSLHLHTTNNATEMPLLIQKIQDKMESDGKNYYVIAGGDFNTEARDDVALFMSSVFKVGPTYPVDQNGNPGTNSKRQKPYDWVLFSHDLDEKEIPMTIGEHTYAHGHVLDSRVYSSCRFHNDANELEDIAPVRPNDTAASNMQHMPVIRDFRIEVK